MAGLSVARRRIARVLLVGSVLAGVDQLAKHRASTHLEAGALELGPGLRLRRVLNPGLAWSWGESWPAPLRRGLGVAGASLALLAILTLAGRSPVSLGGLGLLAGGLAGNLIDRARTGAVVDFLELGYLGRPVVNLADLFLVGGALALALGLAGCPAHLGRVWRAAWQAAGRS